MDHQDWKTVTWDKTNKQKNETNKEYLKRQPSAIVSTVVKSKGSVDKRILDAKLDAEDENFKHKTVSRDISKNIIKKRLELKMTQQDLARKVCISENIIKLYEKFDTKTIYDPNILNKIEKVLGRVRV
jgi:ribosome-binding protein aMBF1 (putative translation factor)